MAHIFERHTFKIIASILLATAFSAYGFCDEEKKDSDSTASITIESAISLAFKNNNDIQIQEREVKVAEAKIIEARSAFLPKVNVNAAYTRNGAILTMPKVIENTLEKDMGVFAGYKNDTQLGLTLDESIYNGGADFARYKQTKLELDVQTETLRARKLDMEFEVKRLYYGLLLAYETERITRDLVEQARLHYEDVKRKFEEGTSSRFDLLQSSVQVSKLMPELVKAGNSIELITADLKKLLGFKMRDSIKLGGELAHTPLKIDEEEFLKEAYANRPEMILSSLDIDINKWAIEMAKAGKRPQISAAAGYSYRADEFKDMFNSNHNNWNVGFKVSIPLFDGFSTKAKVDQARARYAQANLAKEDISDQIAVDIRHACLDLEESEAIINSQKDKIGEAKDALRIANVSYNNGVGTNLDVIDAQVSLSQIEENLYEGIYDHIMAKAYLDRTRGRISLKEKTE